MQFGLTTDPFKEWHVIWDFCFSDVYGILFKFTELSHFLCNYSVATFTRKDHLTVHRAYYSRIWLDLTHYYIYVYLLMSMSPHNIFLCDIHLSHKFGSLTSIHVYGITLPLRVAWTTGIVGIKSSTADYQTLVRPALLKWR